MEYYQKDHQMNLYL